MVDRDALAEMRALIFELRPESLENEGLVVALEKQGASLQARKTPGKRSIQLAASGITVGTPVMVSTPSDGTTLPWIVAIPPAEKAAEADNPDAKLPSSAIQAVHRSDESGTTENFTEYLAAAAGDAWPHEVSGDWPVSGTQSAQGTSGVVQTVTEAEGAITCGSVSNSRFFSGSNLPESV